MRKLALGLVFLFSVSLTSCFAGPHQLSRSVDDWDGKTYVESPWINAALWILPIPAMKFGAKIGDMLVTDAVTFWGTDAWNGENGAGFVHRLFMLVGARRGSHVNRQVFGAEKSHVDAWNFHYFRDVFYAPVLLNLCDDQ